MRIKAAAVALLLALTGALAVASPAAAGSAGDCEVNWGNYWCGFDAFEYTGTMWVRAPGLSPGPGVCNNLTGNEAGKISSLINNSLEDVYWFVGQQCLGGAFHLAPHTSDNNLASGQSYNNNIRSWYWY